MQTTIPSSLRGGSFQTGVLVIRNCHSLSAFRSAESQSLVSTRIPLSSTSLYQPIQKRSKKLHAKRRQPHLTCPRASIAQAVTVISQPPVRDALAFVGSVIGAKALVSIFENLEAAGLMDKKLSRKLVHTLAGPLFLICWPLFSSEPYAQYLAALVPSLNGIRLLLAGTGIREDPRAVAAMSRTGDPTELLRGPLYYVIVLLTVTAVYWRYSPVGVVITSLMCGGDGLADIIGRRFGKTNPLPWNQNKSWAGSVAMFLGGFAMSLGLLTYFIWLGYLDGMNFAAMASAVGAISLVASLIESLPINMQVDDNLSVPGVAAVMGIFLLQMALEL